MTPTSGATPTSASGVDDMTDPELNALLPAAVREASRVYWTSAAVARRAAQIFADLGVRRVLDVGSGPGKFCVVAAAWAPGIKLVGVEHRVQLVEIARSLAAQLGVTNVTFQVGDATEMPWTAFDGIYVFNSLAENDFAAEAQFDATVELSHARHIAEVKRVLLRLAEAPEGTVLITYHGLSGPIPSSFELLHKEAAANGWLRVWRKGDAAADGRFWLEEGDDVSTWVSGPRSTAQCHEEVR
jgi:SAM-dependent methyltransferase